MVSSIDKACWHKLACAYSEDSDQSVHPHSLIIVLVSFMSEENLDPWLPIEHPSKTPIRLRSAQADLSLQWTLVPTCTFCWTPAQL